MSKEEEDAIWDQAAKDLGMGEKVDPSTKVTIQDGPLTWDPDADHNYNWQ